MNNYIFFLLVLLLNTSGFATSHNKNKPEVNKKPFVVMIDAGHGGKDTGTPGTGRYKATEKDIALDVSLALGKLLDDIPNVSVVYTRTKDTYAGNTTTNNDDNVNHNHIPDASHNNKYTRTISWPAHTFTA